MCIGLKLQTKVIGNFSGGGLQYTVYHDSTWEKPIKIQISLSTVVRLTSTGFQAYIGFESRKD